MAENTTLVVMTPDELQQLIETSVRRIFEEYRSKEQKQKQEVKKERVMLTRKEAAAYLSISTGALYRLTSKRAFPCYKPNARTTLFDKADLDAYLGNCRVLSQEEIDAMVDTYFSRRPKRRY